MRRVREVPDRSFGWDMDEIKADVAQRLREEGC
jgi:hypothetical protein